MDDAGIIALFNARDERSLEETAAAYGPWCRAIAMNLLGVREDAEECVSDALHALWRRIPPESPVSLRVYLGRIVRNIAVSRRRERDAQKRGGGQLELLMSELGECVPDGFDVEAAPVHLAGDGGGDVASALFGDEEPGVRPGGSFQRTSPSWSPVRGTDRCV